MVYNDPERYQEGAVLFIDKPLHWTSFDVVNKIRKTLRQVFGIKKIKVGHAGTLDPLATGLVIVCTGRATKQMLEYQDLDKAYTAGIRLGATTPSLDLETEVDQEFPWEHIREEDIQNAFSTFLGETDQLPPQYSAKSVDGKRAYDMARKGREIELKPHRVRIDSLELLSFHPPALDVHVECGKGTYIRSLARDLGAALGSGAHLTSLRRTRIGPHRVENAMPLEDFLEKLKLL
ncbi:MAG: tRNA pseudouridine(55) synthase TruB [Bacteroidales bacterium]